MKWVKERNPSKDEEYVKWFCREKWDKYGEKVIKKAMSQSSCTSISEFIKLCNYFKANQVNQ